MSQRVNPTMLKIGCRTTGLVQSHAYNVARSFRHIMSQESLLLFSKWFYDHRSCRATPNMLQVVLEAHVESGVPASTPSIISYYPTLQS